MTAAAQDPGKLNLLLVPRLRNENNMRHGTAPTLRSGYSPRRITGHDFRYRYRKLCRNKLSDIRVRKLFYSGAENEVEELNGGRVFM